MSYKHGDLVLVNHYNRIPMVVAVVEDIYLLVDVLTYLDIFGSYNVSKADLDMAQKQGYEFKVLADREEYTGNKLYDELFDKCDSVLPEDVLHTNKNIA